MLRSRILRTLWKAVDAGLSRQRTAKTYFQSPDRPEKVSIRGRGWAAELDAAT